MSYWFAYRVNDKNIDISPGSAILKGPFETHEEAKKVKISIRGSDMEKTSIFIANSKSEAENKILNETWMV